MKTNQVLTRRMGDFDVLQRTKDGMFNATELLKQWNHFSGHDKKIDHYFYLASTKEFIKALKTDAGITASNENQIFTKVRGGKVQGTWMSPLLFIDFAMWLNPSFKVKVLKFVYDELIKYRHEAGDAYRQMTSSLKKIVAPSQLTTCIQEVAKAINYIVYNGHTSGIRNIQADEAKTRELAEIEKDIAKFIDLGFITSYNQLLEHLRRQWRNKYTHAINF